MTWLREIEIAVQENKITQDTILDNKIQTNDSRYEVSGDR